jgi:hypothetical protein
VKHAPTEAPLDISLVPRAEHPYPRQVRLGAIEWIGIPLLALLPVLGLVGALGPSNASLAVSVPTAQLRIELSHPARLRHKGDGEMRVLVRNTGSSEQRGLSIGLDQHYLEGFGRVQALPPLQSLGGEALRIELPGLPAGESASVRLMLEAGDWGRHPGWIELANERGTTLARLDFQTLVLP